MKIITVSALLLSLITANAHSEDKVTCNLPADQGSGSLNGSWEKLPVLLTFDREFYHPQNKQDLLALKSAVASWNKWAALKGLVAFTLVNDFDHDKGGMEIPNLDSCSQASYTEALPYMVGVWRIGKDGSRSNERASCGSQLKLLPDGLEGQVDYLFSAKAERISNASILLNFDQFFGPSGKKLDLESVFLHQLGEVLGLGHSCNSGNADSSSAPFCAIAPTEYLEAVMAPFLAEGQVKRKLRKNDYNRINCLYQ